MIHLSGRKALVAGATSGIGEASARALAAAGAQVVIADMNGEAAEAVAREIGGAAWQVDPSDTDALGALSLDVDILVNNAGIQHVSPIEKFDPAKFHLVMTLMLESLFLLVRAALPHIYRNRFGRVVNISSVHGIPESEVFEKVLLTESVIKRLLEPSEVADLVLWLSGDSAGMVTGASYTMDGGWSAR